MKNLFNFIKSYDNFDNLEKLKESMQNNKYKDEDLFDLSYYACENNAIKSFIFLVETFKIDLNAQGDGSKNPLFLTAIRRGSVDIIDYLIQKDCVNFNIRTKNDYTAAHFVIKFLNNNIELVKKIINLQSKDNLNLLAENKYSIDDFIERYIDSNKNKIELKELVANLKVSTINIEKIEDSKNKEIN